MKICKRCGFPVVEETEVEIKKEYPYFCTSCDENMYGFETEEVTGDRAIEIIWDNLEDIPFDGEDDFKDGQCDGEDDSNMYLSEDYHIWKAGTARLNIWHWFDKNHSKGIGWLMEEYEKE